MVVDKLSNMEDIDWVALDHQCACLGIRVNETILEVMPRAAYDAGGGQINLEAVL